jgi:hypothetical protein
LYHEELEAYNESDGYPEVSIYFREDSLENIHFFLSNLSAVEVVEYLGEYKCAENISE